MPKVKTPTRQPGERNLDEPMWLYRYVPPWQVPDWVEAQVWRKAVRYQPVAMVCRDTLISYLNSLDWQIQPRDSDQRDELKDIVKQYTELLDGGCGIDFSDHIEWIGQDLLDLPFGAASELGREGDSPEGDVLWIEPLDAASLYPTLNADFPVVQTLPELPLQTVYFPAHAIDRIGMNPRPEVARKGWYMAPPERIYLAFEMLARGDKYYASLLLDTPEAGILDLIDMEKETAEQWVASFRSLLTGVDPFKIPVLYEHDTPAQFIPFTQPPTAIMFDKLSLKTAAIMCAGYGLTTGDIGLNISENGGDTMAGTIRQERRTRRSGHAITKKKTTAYFNRILPKDLRFSWIDYDEEQQTAIGRARISNAQAYSLLIDKKVVSPKEARLQLVADGMITIPIPENVPEDEFPKPEIPIAGGGKKPGGMSLIGAPTPPSKGGYGEVKSLATDYSAPSAADALAGNLKRSFESMAGKAHFDDLIRSTVKVVYPDVQRTIKELSAPDPVKILAEEFRSLSDRVDSAAQNKHQEPVVVQPQITVHLPEQHPPQVTVHVPEGQAPSVLVQPQIDVQPAEVHLSVPEQPAPQVVVNVPKQPAPVVNVAPAEVNVNVEPPQVEVNPEIHIENPPAPSSFKIERDRDGNISGITEKDS